MIQTNVMGSKDFPLALRTLLPTVVETKVYYSSSELCFFLKPTNKDFTYV